MVSNCAGETQKDNFIVVIKCKSYFHKLLPRILLHILSSLELAR